MLDTTVRAVHSEHFELIGWLDAVEGTFIAKANATPWLDSTRRNREEARQNQYNTPIYKVKE